MEGSELHDPVPRASQVLSRLRSRRVLLAGGLLFVVVAAWFAWPQPTDRPTRAEVSGIVKKAVDSAVADAKEDVASAPARSALVYRRVLPSLVFITTDDAARRSPRPSSPPSTVNPSGNPAPEAERSGGLGTGVIISADGAILTSNHVVAGATVIRVTFADGSSSLAAIEASEPSRDIAVLRAERNPEVVVPAVMGGGVSVGDETYAVGHPLGLVDSLSAGVISGLNRSIPTEDGVVLAGLIQFDAAVNPGNSGGPLLNRNGQVVGIVTALANPSEQGFFVGIGFAVPIDQASGSAGGPSK